jgi:hypothetical protein
MPRPSRLITVLLAIVGALGTVGGLPAEATAAPPAAHRPKVVVVVGPVGSQTSEFRADARRIARQARRYGARVLQVYSPSATWSRVARAARGANLLVYLGHGNGWPSPHGPYQPFTKNGLGLNVAGRRSNAAVAYKGEHFIRRLHLAKDAVVLLNHLCYASGNAEGGGPTSSRRVAKARADNYAKGFQEAGAQAVFAIGLERPGYILRGLFRSDRSMRQIFWSVPQATPRDRIVFDPHRSFGQGILDPRRGRYYFRSLVGDVDMRASRWRQPA